MNPKRTRRLRARAATINTQEDDFEDYGPEPNMKLSHAFLVVLLLHVIAVVGLYAFNSIKAGKSTKLAASKISAQGQAPEPSAQMDPTPQESGNEPPRPPSGEKPPVVAKPLEAPSKVSKAVQQKAGKSTASKVAGAGVAAAAVTASKGRAQESNVAPAASPSGVKTYTVAAGDTMTRIASTLGVPIPELEKINGLVSNAVLQVGQTLKIPEKAVAQAGEGIATQAAKVASGIKQLPGTAASMVSGGNAAGSAPVPPASPATPAVADASTGLAEYTVVKGDSPYKIAKHFKVGFEELMKVNNITDPKKIQIGQKLKIPASRQSKQ